MNTEWIIAGFFALVIAGGLYGLLWIRRHPDA
jgi:hypothetical protein